MLLTDILRSLPVIVVDIVTRSNGTLPVVHVIRETHYEFKRREDRPDPQQVRAMLLRAPRGSSLPVQEGKLSSPPSSPAPRLTLTLALDLNIF